MSPEERERRERFLTSISRPADPALILPKVRIMDPEEPVPVATPFRRVQLVVWHRGSHTAAYYTVPETGWRIDCETRHLVLGKGLPRKLIPLDNVLSYDIEELP